MVFVQRFSDAARLYVQLHILMPDGVFVGGPAADVLPFVPVEPPEHADLKGLTLQLHRRIFGPNSMAWSDLIRRVFPIDALQCECGGRYRHVAMIHGPDVVQTILAAIVLRETSRAPPTGATRQRRRWGRPRRTSGATGLVGRSSELRSTADLGIASTPSVTTSCALLPPASCQRACAALVEPHAVSQTRLGSSTG